MSCVQFFETLPSFFHGCIQFKTEVRKIKEKEKEIKKYDLRYNRVKLYNLLCNAIENSQIELICCISI